MRKLRIFEHMSLDGVIQNSRGQGDDDWPYGDWTSPYRSPAGLTAVLSAYGEGFDLLLGRRTYDSFSAFWPKASGPMAERLNAATKYVVTHRPESLEWGPFESVGPDLVEGVRRVKESDGPGLVCCGSSTLTSALIQHGLVDELVLPINPVLVGTGKRLFAEGTPGRSFELASSIALPSGIVVCAYTLGEPLPLA